MTDPKSPPTADPASYMGATPEAPDTNTNLDSAVPGGPATAADQQATDTIEEQHGEGGGQTPPDPARQMDNSGLLNPTGQGDGASIIGASGDDRNNRER